jgi:hypothetical protein
LSPAVQGDPVANVKNYEGIVSGVCIDERFHLGTLEQFSQYYQEMVDAGPTAAPIFSDYRLVCSKWKINPVNIYPGGLAEVATSGQIVLINNVADPASSLASAQVIAGRFTGSVLVKNIAAGHTTFFSSSQCLFTTMSMFFTAGVTPSVGSTCSNVKDAPFNVQLPADF